MIQRQIFTCVTNKIIQHPLSFFAVLGTLPKINMTVYTEQIKITVIDKDTKKHILNNINSPCCIYLEYQFLVHFGKSHT